MTILLISAACLLVGFVAGNRWRAAFDEIERALTTFDRDGGDLS